MDNDIKFLKETLKLAKKGLGWTNPNPMVGAVIVKNGRIIGQGFHKKSGFPHAEIEALNSVTENPKDATIYINLEPCATFGKTPPCVDAIIKSGIKKVVFSTLDPNPKNHGKGFKKLKMAGIQTSVGILETEARKLNKAFFTFYEKSRPYVAIKFACSLDGKMSTVTGDSKWITNGKARAYARSLRANYQAVLVGINTVISDNPHLGIRMNGRKDPTRIIIDPKLQIPFKANILRNADVVIATLSKADKSKKQLLENKGFKVFAFDGDFIEIKKLLSKLKDLGIISIFVEGGGETLGHFVDEKIIDKVYAFHAPIVIGGGNASTIFGQGAKTVKEAIKLTEVSFKKFDDNFLITGYL